MNKKIHFAFAHMLLCSALTISPALMAEAPTTPTPAATEQSTTVSPAEAEMDSAFEAASNVVKAGPADIPLAAQATLKLPEGYGFIPAAETRRLLEAMGNMTSDRMQGMIMPHDENANWFMVVSYEDAGYIKDDDAKNWDADELLSSIREGTEAANEERRARSIPEMEVVGWIERPQY